MPNVEFSDDPDEQSAATLIRDDHVDFLDPEVGPEAYSDGFGDEPDEGDVLRYGDIGLDKQPSHR